MGLEGRVTYLGIYTPVVKCRFEQIPFTVGIHVF